MRRRPQPLTLLLLWLVLSSCTDNPTTSPAVRDEGQADVSPHTAEALRATLAAANHRLTSLGRKGAHRPGGVDHQGRERSGREDRLLQPSGQQWYMPASWARNSSMPSRPDASPASPATPTAHAVGVCVLDRVRRGNSDAVQGVYLAGTCSTPMTHLPTP